MGGEDEEGGEEEGEEWGEMKKKLKKKKRTKARGKKRAEGWYWRKRNITKMEGLVRRV